MTFSYSIAVWILVVFAGNCRAQTSIKDLINARGELSTISGYLKGTRALEKLGILTSRYTFFAPHNSAFLKIPEQLRSQLNQMDTATANNIFSYLTVSGVCRSANLTISGNFLALDSLATGSLKLFFYRSADNAYYINGARLLEGDLEANNGILHIIDGVFLDIGPSVNAVSGNMDAYITNQQQASRDDDKTAQFKILLNKYDEYMSSSRMIAGPYGSLLDDVIKSGSRLVTGFVPSDTAVTQFKQQNPSRYQELLSGDPKVLQKVMESHFLPGGAYHSGLLVALTANATVAAMQGRIRLYSYNGALYVSNNCASAKVTRANMTTSNGVVYMIDNILGYVIYDLYNLMQREGTFGLSDFWGTMVSASSSFQASLQVSPGTTNVSDDKIFTMFAPNSDAFDGVDFDQNQNKKLEQLNMHLLRGIVSLQQMKNGTQRETLLAGQFAKFYQMSDGLYVEVDYVRAKVVRGDLCATNGVLHVVDRILGVPARTISEEIDKNSKMTFLDTVVQNTGLRTLLQDTSRQLTMFAPVDDAFQALVSESPSYLNRQYESSLRNILMRHVGRGALFLDQIVPFNAETAVNTYNGEIRVGQDNNGYYVLVGSRQIRVIRPNMRMTNGVMHVVDKVLYDPSDPRTAESTSESGRLVPCLPFLLVIATGISLMSL